jgi:hypothetical protein
MRLLSVEKKESVGEVDREVNPALGKFTSFDGMLEWNDGGDTALTVEET